MNLTTEFSLKAPYSLSESLALYRDKSIEQAAENYLTGEKVYPNDYHNDIHALSDAVWAKLQSTGFQGERQSLNLVIEEDETYYVNKDVTFNFQKSNNSIIEIIGETQNQTKKEPLHYNDIRDNVAQNDELISQQILELDTTVMGRFSDMWDECSDSILNSSFKDEEYNMALNRLDTIYNALNEETQNYYSEAYHNIVKAIGGVPNEDERLSHIIGSPEFWAESNKRQGDTNTKSVSELEIEVRDVVNCVTPKP